MRAHYPTAAHLTGWPLEVLFPKTKPDKNLFGLGFEPIPAELIEAVVNIIVDFIRMKGLQRMVSIPRFEDAAKPRIFRSQSRRQLDDRFIANRRILLRQIADAHSAFTGNLAFIGRIRAENDRKQRGLAGAVGTDQPDAILSVHLQSSIGKQNTFAVRFADIGKSQHVQRKWAAESKYLDSAFLSCSAQLLLTRT